MFQTYCKPRLMYGDPKAPKGISVNRVTRIHYQQIKIFRKLIQRIDYKTMSRGVKSKLKTF